MRGMTAEHWMLIAGFLAVVGMQLGTMGDSWHHLATPSFWGGALGQLALLIRAMFSEKPSRTETKSEQEADY